MSEIDALSAEVANYGLNNLRMLLVEYHFAQLKQDGGLTDSQYKMFREVADKHWNKHERTGKQLLCKVRHAKCRRRY